MGGVSVIEDDEGWGRELDEEVLSGPREEGARSGVHEFGAQRHGCGLEEEVGYGSDEGDLFDARTDTVGERGGVGRQEEKAFGSDGEGEPGPRGKGRRDEQRADGGFGEESFRGRSGGGDVEEGTGAEELADEAGAGAFVEGAGVAELFDAPGAEDGEAIAEDEGFLLVVGDVEEGDAEVALESAEFDLKLLAELEIEGGERFVEEQDPGSVDERPGEGDALLLAAGQLVGATSREIADLDEGHGFVDAAVEFGTGHALHAQPEGEVVADVEMREEGVGLEDGVDGAPVGGDGKGVEAVEPELTGVGEVESGDEAEEGGLAAAGGAEEGEELAGGDGEADVVEGGDGAEAAGQVAGLDGGGGGRRR